MKIVLYEPFGCGGICHYTYQLAESLAQSGADVTVLTQENYELSHLKTDFKINRRLGKSQIKYFFRRMITRSEGNLPSTVAECRNQDATLAENNSNNKTILLIARRWLIWFEIIFTFVFNRPKIIHFQWLLYPKEDYYFLIILKILRLKVVYTAHNILPHGDDLENEFESFKKIYKIVDKIVVHTENNKTEIINLFNLDSNKIDVIPHGVYDVFFTNQYVSMEDAKTELGIQVDIKVVLFFGLIRKYKGLENLVDSFKMVIDKINSSLLLIAGKPGGDEDEKKYYTDYIAQLRGRKDVMCIDKYIPFEKVSNYFSASDVVVLPYLKTYQSGILLLSYAAGKPVVVTDTGGLSETVVDGKNGFIVPSENPVALSQAIIKILEDPALMFEMCENVKSLADTKYSWKNIASKTVDAYRLL